MKTFVIEPISNTVSPLTGRLSVAIVIAVRDDAPARRLDHADHDPDALLAACRCARRGSSGWRHQKR